VTTRDGTVQPARRGPVEGEHVIGWDRESDRRPGVPMAGEPRRAAPVGALSEQPGIERRSHRAFLDRPTPVFGTAQPLHGLSGALRSAAYRTGEHQARHWAILMLADRMDVLEGRLGQAAASPLEWVGATPLAERVRANPLPYLAGMVAGGALAGALARARSRD
jgi:hypothetical protein